MSRRTEVRSSYLEKLDQTVQQSGMKTIILPIGFDTSRTSLYAIARDSGLAWDTARDVLQGTGTLASLDRLRAALGLQWSWTGATGIPAAGKALAVRRKAKNLSQRAMAERLSVSPQTIVTLETRFAGRIVTLRGYLRAVGIMDTLVAPARRLVPAANDAAADVVFTPRDLAARIIHTFAEEMSGSVLDPARGDGAFHDALPPHVTRHWCEIAQGRDFFDWTTPVDWIVTNPPWSRFRDFLEHSLRLADNVLFLAPINHFGTTRRVALVSGAGFGLRRVVFVPQPAAWPASGFQLAAVWLQRGWDGPAQIESLTAPKNQAG